MDFPIDDDNIALEPPEILTFTITVIDPIPGIGIDPYGTTIVTIVDEDRKLHFPSPLPCLPNVCIN